MLNIRIEYNPYLVKTEIYKDGERFSDESVLSLISNRRLQEWIEPSGRSGWEGIFDELRYISGSKELRLRFKGTKSDFEDLEYARNRYGKCFKRIELIHENVEKSEYISAEKKMEKLKGLYDELQSGPIEELKTEDIRHSFEAAVNSEFRVVVVAPMSSGKSTLINAIIGKDLLPALNQATTAVITEIKDHDGMDKFIVSATSKDGQKICSNVEATKDLITELNGKKDDKNDGMVFTDSIKIEGDIPNISSQKLSVVFVDTPGGNNSQNEEHMKTMDEAIESEDKSLILYVFNGAQLGTSDSNDILRKISNVMKKASNGKQTRDRFLFVANGMDNFDPDRESYEDAEKNILEMIHNNGIENPRLFFVSALTAKLIRMKRNSEVFTKKEKTDLYGLVEYFNGDGNEKCSLDKFAALGDDEKKGIYNEKKGLSDKLNEMDEEDIGYKKLQYRFAELQSGIPSLEAAINEYLEKYAIAIKIKALHDTFMGKVEERNMLYNFEQKIATSSAEYDSVCAALMQKQERLEKLNAVGAFMNRVKSVKPVDFSGVDKIRKELANKILEIQKVLPAKIEVKECEYHLENLNNELTRKTEEAMGRIKKELESGLVLTCENVVREYEEQFKKMDEEGIFQIGAFKFRSLSEFEKFQHIDINDLMRRKVTEAVKVGTKKVAKEGVFSAIMRFFGCEGGWELKDEFKDKDFVRFKEFAKEKLAEFSNDFDKNIDEKKEDVKRKEKEIKAEVEKHLGKLQEYVGGTMEQIKTTLRDREALEKRVKEDADKKEWLENFIKEVDSVLDI